MIVKCVHIHVKRENLQEFLEATAKNHVESVKEPGNFRFDVLQSTEDPTRFMLYEAYRSEEDSLSHKSTHHYELWRDLAADWMAEPRTADKYNFIKPDKFEK